MTSPVGLRAIAYRLAARTATLGDLAAAGQLESDPGVLHDFGFEQVHVATAESPFELALAASRAALDAAAAEPESVDLLIYGGLPDALGFAPAAAPWDTARAVRTTARFKYPGTRLAYELGLNRASVFALGQLACTTLFAAVRLARALCATEGLRRVLCVNAEFFPPDAGREALFNCTSDAAVAMLIEAGAERRVVRGAAQVTKGYYWDCDAQRNQIVASYFPTSRHAAQCALADAGWRAADVDWVIPHNVSRRSWDILLGLLGLPNARLWDRNIARRGHTLAGDNFMNLADAVEAGDVRDGDRLLLFSFGYGAHWTALAVEA